MKKSLRRSLIATCIFGLAYGLAWLSENALRDQLNEWPSGVVTAGAIVVAIGATLVPLVGGVLAVKSVWQEVRGHESTLQTAVAGLLALACLWLGVLWAAWLANLGGSPPGV